MSSPHVEPSETEPSFKASFMSNVDIDDALTQSPGSLTPTAASDADLVSVVDARNDGASSLAGSPAPTNNSTSAASDDMHEKGQLGDVPAGGHPLPGDEDIGEEYEKLDITDEHFANLQLEHKKHVAGSNLYDILLAVEIEKTVKQTALKLPPGMTKLRRLIWVGGAEALSSAVMERVIGPGIARSERASPNASDPLHRVQTGKITKKQK